MYLYWQPEGLMEWKRYIRQLKADSGIRYLLMEFVKDGKKEQFIESVKH